MDLEQTAWNRKAVVTMIGIVSFVNYSRLALNVEYSGTSKSVQIATNNLCDNLVQNAELQKLRYATALPLTEF
jgi:hypothetical protein